jgi:hypothetical protein
MFQAPSAQQETTGREKESGMPEMFRNQEEALSVK